VACPGKKQRSAQGIDFLPSVSHNSVPYERLEPLRAKEAR
jgi:hypothetical protein